MSRLDVWRTKLWWWLPPLVFLLLNLAFLSAYQLVYQGRQIVLEGRIEQAETDLEALRALSAQRADELERAVANRDRVERFYDEQLATESERLTRTIAEVKELENRVGLRPRSMSYPEETIGDFGLVRKAIVFGVEGTYIQLRQFINLLELSDSFLILEQVGLSNSSRNDPRLRINLRLATYFVDEEALAEARSEGRSGSRRRGSSGRRRGAG
jgi:hypothetical protein